MAPAAAAAKPLLMTRRQLAEATHLSERYLYTLTKLGKLPVVRIGKSVRYNPDVALNALSNIGAE
jgi:excisionase family DNA binding protein